MKSFEELAALQQALRAQAAAQARENERLRREARQQQLNADVFQRAVCDVEPLKSFNRYLRPPTEPPPIARQHELDEAAALAQSLSDDIDIELLLDSDETLSYRRPGVGADVLRRLRKGEWAIKRQIDLHGLRVDQARAALTEFLAQALRSEHRCVRVIHGKGLGSPNRQPVLKGKVLKWLVQRYEVLAFCQARPNDGGAGALIVLLQVRVGGG